MSRILIMSVGLVALSFGNANAGSVTPPVIEVPVVSAAITDWSGAYIGAFGGFASGNYLQLDEVAGREGVDVAVDGGIFGVKGGYNFQSGNIVYGVEADYGNGPAGVTPQNTYGPNYYCGSGDCSIDIISLATVRLRVGYVSGNWLVFGTAGLATAEVEGGIENSSFFDGGTATGWAAGVGGEYRINSNMSVSADALFVDLGSIPFGTESLDGNPFVGQGNFTEARLGVNWSF